MISSRFIRRSFWKKLSTTFYSTVSLPDIDTVYYCDARNATEIKENIDLRKGVGDINRVLDIYSSLQNTPDGDGYHSLREDLYKELSKLPNRTHPAVQSYKDEPQLVHEINTKRNFGTYSPLQFSEITDRLNLMRTDKLGNTCGNKSYYYVAELAELEEALIKYTVLALLSRKFQLVSVPDILSSNVLKSCGMTINSDRTQVSY